MTVTSIFISFGQLQYSNHVCPITNLGSLGHLYKTYSFWTTRPKGKSIVESLEVSLRWVKEDVICEIDLSEVWLRSVVRSAVAFSILISNNFFRSIKTYWTQRTTRAPIQVMMCSMILWNFFRNKLRVNKNLNNLFFALLFTVSCMTLGKCCAESPEDLFKSSGICVGHCVFAQKHS